MAKHEAGNGTTYYVVWKSERHQTNAHRFYQSTALKGVLVEVKYMKIEA